MDEEKGGQDLGCYSKCRIWDVIPSAIRRPGNEGEQF